MYLVIDVGGTKTLIALFSKRGRVLRRRKFPTAQGSKTFIRDLQANLEIFKKYKIKSVAIAVPGVVQKNYTVHLGNRNWGDFDILSPVKSLFSCPVYIENDASLAALFEAHRLHGKTIFLTFSTGIGGGIVESNHILPESGKFEPGHRLYWYDGREREWEDIAAASAIGSYYHVERATDLRKKEILEDIAIRVSLGLPDIIGEYSPDTIILGGPLGKIFKLYSSYLPKGLEVRLCRPKRPLESAIYGGYLYSKQKERE